MAAISASTDTAIGRDGAKVRRYYGTGAANQADTLTTPAVEKHHSQRLAYVTVAYSNTPTQAGVTVGIDSVLGSAYDCTLTTGSANARYTVYLPNEDIILLPGDAIVVAAPAGGGSLTASIVVVLEET